MSYKNGYDKLERENRAYKLLTTALIISLAVSMIDSKVAAMEQARKESLIWPVSKEINIFPEREVEKEVVKYELPQTVEDDIKAVFGDDAETALRVAVCESGLNPKAKNSQSSARGIYQILSQTHEIKEAWLYNPSINIRAAKQLFDRQGWTPWEASRHCWEK